MLVEKCNNDSKIRGCTYYLILWQKYDSNKKNRLGGLFGGWVLLLVPQRPVFSLEVANWVQVLGINLSQLKDGHKLKYGEIMQWLTEKLGLVQWIGDWSEKFWCSCFYFYFIFSRVPNTNLKLSNNILFSKYEKS